MEGRAGTQELETEGLEQQASCQGRDWVDGGNEGAGGCMRMEMGWGEHEVGDKALQ